MTPQGKAGAARQPLLQAHEYFRRGQASEEGWSLLVAKDRDWESFYRGRWQHDKVVRSTHGVNCTGSCSWNVYVKDGLITWEAQAVDYPSTGPEMPEYEPRGCPRGASFSWYTYSPLRVRYPYVRGSLLELFREARARLGDPVAAWAEIVEDPEKAQRYKRERGRGGFVRASWQEAIELVAAAHVYTIRRYGPDRVAGFTPIPAMSLASYASGTRFLALIGGVILSFYDWYSDLPPASPQVFGDQTDVPESGDWWNAGYLIIWGTNLPTTRTPDAHFMVEARYRGQKVAVVSPDYAEHTKFADHWLPAKPGTDAALAMAMGHVVLKEFWVDRQVPYFTTYARRFTDLPLLVTLREHEGAWVPDRFLRASDLGSAEENAEWKPVVLDERTGAPVVPNGSVGHRYAEGDEGRWNLRLGDVEPALTLLGRDEEQVEVLLPRFDAGAGGPAGVLRRGVPALRAGRRLVTTVLDLVLAQYGVARPGLPGEWPAGYDDPAPCTPAWQEELTAVDRRLAARIGREFARNAELTEGRSMIAMGAGTNHWFHSDLIYRSFLALLFLCGCEGRNGGGWAHYVGQEKVRPLAGWQTVAFALDWVRPPRHQSGTPWFYLASDQWRYEGVRPYEDLSSPLSRGLFRGRHAVDLHAQAARLGWLPSHPAFDRNPLDLADEAERAGLEPADYAVRELQAGRLRFASDDPDAPENLPRVLTVWRANVLGSSGKGHEYFLKHLVGSPEPGVRAQEAPEDARPAEVTWREEAPEGKLDLLLTIDFRMTSNALFSDVVLPAATWYEKVDLSSTDLHPFVHGFDAAIAPPWETKSDWDTFRLLAGEFSRLAEKHLGVRRDLVAAPLEHDTPAEIAQPFGEVRDWRAGECEPVPGRTMPKLLVIERDYPAVAAKHGALGPLVETLGTQVKGASWTPLPEVRELGAANGIVHGGPGDGRPSLERVEHACEAILALSGTTNGRLAVEGFRSLERRTGVPLADLAGTRAGDRIILQDVHVQPRSVITSPEWSGIEAHNRRYAPFTTNVEREKPWHTLSGRQHFYLDHAWLLELGEGLPIYRPPLAYARIFGDQGTGDPDRPELTLSFVTPHSKWSIHSEYQDNLHMLTLFRGGSMLWLSREDAEVLGIADNDWIELYNRNGVVACRAAVTHRMQKGTCMMYHAKDRHLNTPKTELLGNRGGTDNSLTRITMKPAHLVGGYAQLSFAFNYYGPTGSQRDEIIVVRKREQELEF